MTYQLPLNDIQRIKIENIDLKTSGPVLLFTPKKLFVLLRTIILSTTLDGTPDGPMSSLGTNSPDYNDLEPAIGPGFIVQNNFYQYSQNFSIAVSDPIYFNIGTADTGSTTNLASIYLLGFYV